MNGGIFQPSTEIGTSLPGDSDLENSLLFVERRAQTALSPQRADDSEVFGLET
jgi:hypothetical protein